MTPILGKRKRRDQVLSIGADADPRTDTEASQHLQSLLQQHFEAKFKPLEASHQAVYKRQDVKVQPPNDETESDWTGTPEEEDEEPAQIVRYQLLQRSRIDVPKEELKMFMVWAPKNPFLRVIADLFYFQVNQASIYRHPVDIDSQTETARASRF